MEASVQLPGGQTVHSSTTAARKCCCGVEWSSSDAIWANLPARLPCLLRVLLVEPMQSSGEVCTKLFLEGLTTYYARQVQDLEAYLDMILAIAPSSARPRPHGCIYRHIAQYIMTHASYLPECTVSQWQRNTAGAKHAHQACDANALKTAQRYKEQVRTVKIIPPGGIASGPHCISNLLHTVLLKKQQKLEVKELIQAKKTH